MDNLNVDNRTIFCHDNLEVLQGINDGCIDLIYLDPPFNKKKQFHAPVGSNAAGASFSDIFRKKDIKDEWVDSIEDTNETLYTFLKSVQTFENEYNYCYLVYMSIRLLECHRVLKDAGSIYLHCDQTMSHYLKIVMDQIFEERNFRNEIVWQRNDGRGKGSQHAPKKWGANTDTILFYAKSNKAALSPYKDLTPEEIDKKFNKTDENGRRYYTGIPIFCARTMQKAPGLCYEWKGYKNPYPSGWRLSKERLEEEYKKGNVVIREDGKLERRKYLDEYEGKPIDNNWTDISRVLGEESTNYPTQKPIALLNRIIEASSNPGDVVLDPFCGCATTCVAAEKLDRNWIGIDRSKKAYDLVKDRLKKEVQGQLESGQLNMLDYDKAVIFDVSPPKRGTSVARKPKSYVYVISNPNNPGEYKVGIAKDVKARLSSYQTSDPKRGFKLEFDHLTTDFREVEKYIHRKFNGNHEWVTGELDEITNEIENYKPPVQQALINMPAKKKRRAKKEEPVMLWGSDEHISQYKGGQK